MSWNCEVGLSKGAPHCTCTNKKTCCYCGQKVTHPGAAKGDYRAWSEPIDPAPTPPQTFSWDLETTQPPQKPAEYYFEANIPPPDPSWAKVQQQRVNQASSGAAWTPSKYEYIIKPSSNVRFVTTNAAPTPTPAGFPPLTKEDEAMSRKQYDEIIQKNLDTLADKLKAKPLEVSDDDGSEENLDL
jgi:hypothetical protein